MLQAAASTATPFWQNAQENDRAGVMRKRLPSSVSLRGPVHLERSPRSGVSRDSRSAVISGMTRGKIWDYLHNGVSEEKSVIISSSSDDDDDKDLSDDDDGGGGGGIKVKINRKLDLLREEPNRPSVRPSLALFLSGVVPHTRPGVHFAPRTAATVPISSRNPPPIPPDLVAVYPQKRARGIDSPLPDADDAHAQREGPQPGLSVRRGMRRVHFTGFAPRRRRRRGRKKKKKKKMRKTTESLERQ